MACPSFTLSPIARSQLAEQVQNNGEFHHFLSGADAASGDEPVFQAILAVEQSGPEVSVQVRLGQTVNTLTLRRTEDTARKVAMFLEELTKAYAASTDLELVLRNAVREQGGCYSLPQCGVEGLGVVLTPSTHDPERTIFRFVLNGVGITLPMLLPGDHHHALRLLTGCVDEIKGWR